MRTEKIILRGEKQTPADTSPADGLQLEASYLMRGSVRGAFERHEVKLDDDSIVQFVFDDTTTWFCSPNTIDEVFPEAAVSSRAVVDGFEIPLGLQGAEVERGLVGNILLKVVNVFSKKKVSKAIGELAANLEKKQLENQIGLFRLDAAFQLQAFASESSDQPYLLFLHGTASSTRGSFGGLEGTDAWNFIHQKYNGRVITFQHESLTKSPLQNVLDLVKALPKSCTLHIISQSHGGQVGEVLSRFCDADGDNKGFNDEEVALLKKAKRDEDVKNIGLLQKAVDGKRITIERFIRVACPAGGSTLASKRLDHFFNVLFNLIGFGTGLASNLVFEAFKNLIVAVIESKNDVNTLPGVEALNPKSPFVEILSHPLSSVEVDNSLIVISGNCKAKVNLKALLVIASKLFFGHSNDLVVDTDSMYLGARRKGMVQFFLDEGSEVDHFHYFKNKRTLDALLNALKTEEGKLIPDFQLRDTALLETERGIFGLEGGQLFPKPVSGSKPIVVLLPGIMGSNITQNKRLIWIDYRKFLAGELRKLNISSGGMDAPSVVKTSYGKLAKYLSDTYDVVVFPFDWRLPLPESAKAFNAKLVELMNFNQPIKIIGHSMGGVLVRDFIAYYPNTWTKLNASMNFRLIFLGAPLGGSFRIPSVLFGQDGIINTLSKVDVFHTKKELLQVFSKLPGILSLLPHAKEQDFSAQQTWNEMRDAFGEKDWPLPTATDLGNFGTYRDKVHVLFESMDYTNVTYIAGRDKATPCGYRIDEGAQGKELVFLSTAEGDQSVTWESGIPTRMIEENAVYYVNVTHGALANEPSIFDGIADILMNGATALLSKTRPSVRGDQKVFRSPEPVNFDLTERGVENALLGLAPKADVEAKQAPLRLCVSNGDLKYASSPVLAGHFNNDGILYAEKVIDGYLKGALRERLQLGLYPGLIGTNEVLFSSQGEFGGAIIVGLGDFGSLTAFQLTKTVEQGIAKYLIVMNNKSVDSPSLKGVSSLLIGSGYGGLTIEDSVTAIVQGVSNANDKVGKLYGDRAQLIARIEFVEQDKNKALQCFYALHRIEKNSEQTFSAVLDKRVIVEKPGAIESGLGDNTVGWWTRITVQVDYECAKERRASSNGKTGSGGDRADDTENENQNLRFNITTGGAREEQRILRTSRNIIEGLINEISSENNWSASKAKTIFELLIPNDFKDQVKKQNNIAWVVDAYSAAYPWELLQDSVDDAKPLAINAGMIRQLATQNYRQRINAVANKKALVVGDPDLGGFIGQLPGAFKEAQLVDTLLASRGYDTTPVLRGTPGRIVEALFSTDYKMIHLAGHGVYDPQHPDRSGMVIGNNVFLSTKEISQMSTVPELVFVNCCFLGKANGGDEKYYQDRYKLAANIGIQLIQNGVKVVIAAGWAVDDQAALEFTEVFYKCMLAGYAFGDAIKKARGTVYAKFKSTNTWGAYQCYGDQFYKLHDDLRATKENEYEFVTPGECLMALSNLHSTIETGNGLKNEYMAKIQAIAKATDLAGLRNHDITEREAMIYADLYEYNLALAAFQNLRSEKITFSLPAMDRYCSIRVKKCITDYQADPKTASAQLKIIKEVLNDQESMLQLWPTAGRYGGLGATYKRQSLLLQQKTQKIKAYSQMTLYYQRAYASPNNPYGANALANWLQGEFLLTQLTKRKWGDEIKTRRKESYGLPASLNDAIEVLSRAKNILLNMPPDKMDYRDLVCTASLELSINLLRPKPTSANSLLKLYMGIWSSAGSQGKKISEIEHFDFLIDALSLLPKQKSAAALTMLNYLKTELSKLA
jgi:CHAT domain-containing protein